jgi:hypothetical protein
VLLPLTLSRANNLYSVNLFLVFVSLLFSSFLSISLNEFVYNRLELNPEEILFLQFTWLDSFKIKTRMSLFCFQLDFEIYLISFFFFVCALSLPFCVCGLRWISRRSVCYFVDDGYIPALSLSLYPTPKLFVSSTLEMKEQLYNWHSVTL